MGLRSQRLWNPSDLTLGGSGCGSLQNMAGAKVSTVVGSFFQIFTAKKLFDPCIQKCLRDDSFEQCSKIAGFLGKQGFGSLGALAREIKVSKTRDLPLT